MGRYKRPVQFNPSRNAVSYSTLSAWLSCRQLAKFRLNGWQPLLMKGALAFGSMMHNALEDLYLFRQESSEKRPRTFRTKALNHVFSLLEKYVRQEQNKTGEPADLELLEHCQAVIEGLLPGYMLRWKADFTKTKWLGLEARFRVPFSGFTLSGIRDGVFLEGKELWLLETKTASRVSADLLDTLLLDAQNLFYMLATYLELEQRGTARRPRGVVYNLVRRPEHKVKDGESSDDYSARIAGMVEEDPDHWFQRYEAFYPRASVEEFAAQLQPKLKEFSAWCWGDIPTYRNESNCAGRWTCEFVQACSSGEMHGYVRRPFSGRRKKRGATRR